MLFKENDTFEKDFTVSEKVYSDFIAFSGDRNPLHTDETFARSKGFEGRVMHGNILNGFISYFIGECLPDKQVIIHSQEIQYKKPVYLNDTLKFSATVSDIFESVQAIEIKFNFRNAAAILVAKGKIQIGII